MDRYQEEVQAVASGVRPTGNIVVIAMAKKTVEEFNVDVALLRESLGTKEHKDVTKEHKEPAHDSLSRLFKGDNANSDDASGGSGVYSLREIPKVGKGPRDSLSRILD